MAVIQAGAPLGIMLGYVFSGAMTTVDEEGGAVPSCPPDLAFTDAPVTCRWRWPFYLQSVVLLGFSAAALLVPAKLYDIDKNLRMNNAVVTA